MSVWHGMSASSLSGTMGGALSSILISIAPGSLELLLDCLSSLSFPIDPEIYHGVPTTVEFAAWQTSVPDVRHTLIAYGFSAEHVRVQDVLDSMTS